MRPFVIALTGASGVAYGVRLVNAMARMGHEMALVISNSARLVMKEELGAVPRNLFELFDPDHHRQIKMYDPEDFTAPIASGSYPTEGMVIVPCSMGTLGAMASGVSQNLIHRAADCMLKEGRKLVLVPRETPLNAIHLENMLKLARMGVRMVPAMPGFYSGIQNVEGMIDFIVGKVLDQLNVPHALYPRWTGSHSQVHLD